MGLLLDAVIELHHVMSHYVCASPQFRQEKRMTKLTYEIIEHDGGWSYRVDETPSDPVAIHDAVHRAAELEAKEQSAPSVRG